MTEHAEIEERRQDVAAQSVPEKKEVDKVDEFKKNVKHYVDSWLSRVYVIYGGHKWEIDKVNNVFDEIVKVYNPNDKEFVGFLEYIYMKINKQWNFEGLSTKNDLVKLFWIWRNDKNAQNLLYRSDYADRDSNIKQYYNYLGNNSRWVRSMLDSFEIVEKYWGASTYEQAVDNFWRAAEVLSQKKNIDEQSITKMIDDRINWFNLELAKGNWNERNEVVRLDNENEIKKLDFLKNWIIKKRESSEYSISWANMIDVYFYSDRWDGRLNFRYVLDELLIDAKDVSELENLLNQDVERWHKQRRDSIRKNKDYFNVSNLAYLSIIEQVLRWWASAVSQDFYKMVEDTNIVFSEADIITVKEKIYWNCSYSEILWELIMSWNWTDIWKDGDVLKKLQLFMWIFSTSEYCFKMKHDWKLDDDDIYWFLYMLKNDEKFKSWIGADKYIAKINEILGSSWKGDIGKRKWSFFSNLFDWEHKWNFWNKELAQRFITYSSFVEEKMVYLNDPVAYRKSQERWHRDFVWVRREKSAYPTISSDTQVERSFISNSANQSSKLNWEIAKWLDMSWKTLEQQKEIEERLIRLIPKDKIHGVLNDLLSNPDVRRNFVENLNMPEELLDDEILFDRIINYETWDQQFENIKERFFWKLWENKWDVIINFAGELSGFLKEQIGVSALNVRKDFLENIFWFSIAPVELPWQKDDVFYFRDQYHPETLYEYKPKTWEIFAHESISLRDWEILFNWARTEQKRLIYTLKKYSEYLDWVDIFWVLPMWWDRPDSFESLQDEVSRNIQRYMHVDVWFTEVEWIHERNDTERMKNEIVNKAREILWITQDQLTESQDWPYYELLLTVINTIQNVSRGSLAEIRFFFDQISDIVYSINNWISVSESSLSNPLLKFIVEKTKNLENRGNNEILDAKTKKYWKEKDLPFWSIIRELMYTDVDWMEKLNVSSIMILNGAREWSSVHERFMKGIRDRYNQLCNPLTELKNQELSSLDEWRDNAVQWIIRETWSEVADLWHFVRADQKLDREMDRAFELEFDVDVKIPDNPQNDIA